MRLYLLALLAIALPALGQDFAPATVLDVQTRQGFSNGLLGQQVESDNYTEVTVRVGDVKVSARTYPIGGGVIYLASHPEAVMVGSTVQAKIAKRGELHIEAPDGKLLKFRIQRMEKLAP